MPTSRVTSSKIVPMSRMASAISSKGKDCISVSPHFPITVWPLRSGPSRSVSSCVGYAGCEHVGGLLTGRPCPAGPRARGFVGSRVACSWQAPPTLTRQQPPQALLLVQREPFVHVAPAYPNVLGDVGDRHGACPQAHGTGTQSNQA